MTCSLARFWTPVSLRAISFQVTLPSSALHRQFQCGVSDVMSLREETKKREGACRWKESRCLRPPKPPLYSLEASLLHMQWHKNRALEIRLSCLEMSALAAFHYT